MTLSKKYYQIRRYLSICAICCTVVIFTATASYANSFNDEVELDPYLRASVINRLGRPVDDPDPVTLEELHSITGRIGVIKVPIRKLTGLEHLTGIDQLAVGYTEVKDFSAISSLTKLKYLYLYDNTNMEELPSFTGLDELIVLEAQYNRITDISVLKDAKHLQWVMLNDNKIKKLPDLSSLKDLQTLILSSNEISEIEQMSDMPSLTEVDLQDNMITDISPFKNLKSLEYLSVRYNKISHLRDEDVFPYLDTLYLDGNRLESYNFNIQFPILTCLGMGDCGLTCFGPLLTHPTINALYVSDNNITDVSEIVEMENSVIELISLRNNDITDLTPFSGYDFPFPIYLDGNPIDLSNKENVEILLRLFEKFPQVKFNFTVPLEASSTESSDDQSASRSDGSFYSLSDVSAAGPEAETPVLQVTVIAAVILSAGLLVIFFRLHRKK